MTAATTSSLSRFRTDYNSGINLSEESVLEKHFEGVTRLFLENYYLNDIPRAAPKTSHNLYLLLSCSTANARSIDSWSRMLHQ